MIPPYIGGGELEDMSNEDNRFSARAARYVKVGTNVGAVGLRMAGDRLTVRIGVRDLKPLLA